MRVTTTQWSVPGTAFRALLAAFAVLALVLTALAAPRAALAEHAEGIEITGDPRIGAGHEDDIECPGDYVKIDAGLLVAGEETYWLHAADSPFLSEDFWVTLDVDFDNGQPMEFEVLDASHDLLDIWIHGGNDYTLWPNYPENPGGQQAAISFIVFCLGEQEVAAPTPTPTPEVDATPTPTPEVDATPTPTPEVVATPTQTPEGQVAGETGTPAPTGEQAVLPDTAAVQVSSSLLAALFAAALLLSLFAIAGLNAAAVRRRR